MTVTVAPAPAPMQGNYDVGALLTFAAQGAGTSNGPRISSRWGRGIKLVIDITALTGTSPTLTVTLEGYDVASGKAYTVLASAALAAVATTVLTVYPGIAVTANISANDHLPTQWDVKAVIAGTSPAVTATIGAEILE